jgi:hypothetical protein
MDRVKGGEKKRELKGKMLLFGPKLELEFFNVGVADIRL